MNNQINKDIEKVCLICSKNTVESVYAALVMANGAVMDGIETKLFFTFFGMDAITKTKMDKLLLSVDAYAGMSKMGNIEEVTKMIGQKMDALDMPPIGEFLELITAGGGEIYACKLAIDMFDLKQEDLHEEVSGILTIGEFYELADGDRTQVIFI